MKFVLKLKPEDCSPLGQLILQYIEEQGMSMNQLAKQAELTQPGVRAACLKGTNPTETTLRKLALVIGKHPVEIYLLAYGDRIQSGIPCEEIDTITFVRQAFIDIFNALSHGVSCLPEELRPSDSELVDTTLKKIKTLKAQPNNLLIALPVK